MSIVVNFEAFMAEEADACCVGEPPNHDLETQ